MKRKESDPRGYFYLRLFVFFVIVLICLTGVVRAVSIFREREFTGESYTTLYSNGKDNFLISYHTPSSYGVAELIDPPNLSLEKASRLQLSLALGVPVDAIVVNHSMKSEDDIFSLLDVVKMIFFPHAYVLRDINGIDAFKYFWERRGVSEENFMQKRLEYKNLDEEKLTRIFRDEDIFNSGISIEVVNGTEVGGLGGEFASVLTHRGYNVISVTNADSLQKYSFLHFNRGMNSSVGKSLMHLFGKVEDNSKLGEAADIVVVLGGDVAK